MEDSKNLWLLGLLLLAQALLGAARAVLTRSRWEWEKSDNRATEPTAHNTAIPPRPDITQLSATVDLALLLVTGYYLYLGLSNWLPALQTYELALFPLGATWFHLLARLLLLLLLCSISLSLGRLGPEAIGHSFAGEWHDRVLTAVTVLHVFLSPFSRAALALGNLLSRWLGADVLQRTVAITEEELQSLITAGGEEGIIEESAGEMISSIFQLNDTITREVMLPRIDIVALDVDTPLPEIFAAIVQSGHSRLPIYEDTIDNVVGLLHAKDLLQYQTGYQETFNLHDILRPASFVPEAKRLDSLLKEMQDNKTQLSIVVDEYGGVAGLVTLEDIVEEIVGEIQDEYDQEEPAAVRQQDGTYLFDGRIPLDDVQELLHIPLPLEEVDSLGGFVYNQLGHIPTIGEQIQVRDVIFAVIEIAGRRIRKIRAVPAPSTHTEA